MGKHFEELGQNYFGQNNFKKIQPEHCGKNLFLFRKLFCP